MDIIKEMKKKKKALLILKMVAQILACAFLLGIIIFSLPI